jgi:anaerobic selenocysteine-containing dehydrogenase
MHTGKPYPIKALINHGTNLLTQFPEPKTVYKALEQLDLSIHFNYMMTPTAALADYVLPAAHWLERDEIPLIAGLWQPAIEARVQTVEPYGESRNEQQVILDIYWKLIEPMADNPRISRLLSERIWCDVAGIKRKSCITVSC